MTNWVQQNQQIVIIQSVLALVKSSDLRKKLRLWRAHTINGSRCVNFDCMKTKWGNVVKRQSRRIMDEREWSGFPTRGSFHWWYTEWYNGDITWIAVPGARELWLHLFGRKQLTSRENIFFLGEGSAKEWYVVTTYATSTRISWKVIQICSKSFNTAA